MHSPGNSFRWRFDASTVLSFVSAICNRDSQQRAASPTTVPKDLMREDLSLGYPALQRQLSTGNVRGLRALGADDFSMESRNRTDAVREVWQVPRAPVVNYKACAIY